MRQPIVNLNRDLLPVSLWAAIAVTLTACPSTPVKNSPGANNGNAPAAASSPTVATAATPSETTAVTGSLATPTDAYRTAHALRGKKDVQGMKRVLSTEILEFFTEIGKMEKKSLDDMLLELCEKPQAPTAEARNEKITGDRAMIEYKDEDGEWKEMDFVKEGGEWKLTLPRADSPGAPQKP
jgi:hypothetical protein